MNNKLGTLSAVLAVCMIGISPALAGNTCYVWSEAAGPNFDGSRKDAFDELSDAGQNPFCKTVAIVPSATPLEGGIVLDNGQKLVGLGADPRGDSDGDPFNGDEYSLIRNGSTDPTDFALASDDGDAVTCLGTCTVRGIWITSADKNGINAELDNGVAGDLKVRRIRVSNHNQGKHSRPAEAASLPPDPTRNTLAPGVLYSTSVDGEARVRDSIVENGEGFGIRLVGRDTARLQSRVQSVTVRNLSIPDTGPILTRVVGIALRALGNANHEGVVRDCTLEEIPITLDRPVTFGIEATSVTGADGLIGGGYPPATVDVVLTHNTLRDAGDIAIKVGFTHDGPNQSSAVINHNDISYSNLNFPAGAVILGIEADLMGDNPPNVDTITVKHNQISGASPGIDLGSGLAESPGTGHKADFEVSHNWISHRGAGIFLTNNASSGGRRNSIVVTHNMVIADPEFPGDSTGVFMISESYFPIDPAGAPSRRTETDIEISHNKIKAASPLGGHTGILFFNGIGDCLLSVSPPFTDLSCLGFSFANTIPDWDFNVLVEKNCIEGVNVGFGVFDFLAFASGVDPISGIGYSDEVFDLGHGPLGSAGFNDFIDVDVGMLFVSPLVFVPGLSSPIGSVPGGRIFAENNYWGGGDAILLDTTGLLGSGGGSPALPDTIPFRTSGPPNCGDFSPPDDDDDDSDSDD